MLIDPTKEPLHIVLKPYRGVTSIPAELTGPDQMVFVELNKCFKKAGFVAEGMMGNIIWGFELCGFDPRHVAAGLTSLRAKGYIVYTDERREAIHEYGFDGKKPIWIRYAPKFTNLLVKELSL
jgi:hypothetical protein